MIIARTAAVVAALILVAAAANGTITSTGGYGTPQSYATIAVAVGVVVGSGIFGYVRSLVLGGVLFVCLVAGEGYALLNTANRVVAASDAAQAPLKDARDRHDDAVKALSDARAAKPRPASRDRLEAAERAKDAADKAARDQASATGCRKNCADLLQAVVNNAAREVGAARSELEDHDRLELQRLAGDVAKAETALKAAPLPPSATPFADRIGCAPWIIDLSSAFMLSIGLNGLAACLIAFATHSQIPRPVKVAEPTRVEITPPARPTTAKANVVNLAPPKMATLDVLDFGADHLAPAPGDSLDFDEFFNAYAVAAKAEKMKALPHDEFATPFKTLCEEAGIRLRRRGNKVFLCDVRLAS